MSVQYTEREEVTIRFAGDSGDGMQLTGSLFTNTTALEGNDLRTLPEFPAEYPLRREPCQEFHLFSSILEARKF
ncbi:MAG: hypothetical protein U5K69_19505 [Balneolaceae bacterium]|nr:hypothetical protein [Balneolaceae bacterium]